MGPVLDLIKMVVCPIDLQAFDKWCVNEETFKEIAGGLIERVIKCLSLFMISIRSTTTKPRMLGDLRFVLAFQSSGRIAAKQI
jgi:hypothetical protein